MYTEELKNICSKIDDKKYMISLSLNKEIRVLIESATSWMDNFYPKLPLRIRCLSINSNYTIDTFPKCPVCDNPVGYDKKDQKKFNTYCSDSCSKKSQTRLLPGTYQRLSDYQWLYQKRIIEKYSFESLAELLSCSIEPIHAACKRHNIPHVRHNESNALTNSFLKNKEWLYQRHVIDHKKLQEIADEIGSSAATVSVWLNRHGIIANNPNSYDRINQGDSKECQEFCEFLESLDLEVQKGNRSILQGYEIDAVVESHKIGFEYNGIYSHLYRPEESNYAARKDKTYHLMKTNKALDQGYKLFHVWSCDWLQKKEIWKSMIRSKVGLSQKIYARKCKIIQLSVQDRKVFFEENHLQGQDRSKVNFALEYGGEVVALMSFGHARFTKKYRWELIRFAQKKNITVVGGFSKLLSRFRSEYPGSIISYADRAYSHGGVYESNGFTKLSTNRPTAWVVDLNDKNPTRRNRMGYTKKKIGVPNDIRTENEILRDMGLHQIYDCGTFTYILED